MSATQIIMERETLSKWRRFAEKSEEKRLKCVAQNEEAIRVIELLRTRLASAEEALEFCLHSAEHLHGKPVPEGLSPMFYHTLTYEGDLELHNKTKRAREHFAKFKESEK